MEEDAKVIKKKNVSNGITYKIESSSLQWHKKITVIDLSNTNIADIEGILQLPPNLIELNLSHNKLCEVPGAVLELEHLKNLDVSFNSIQYFDDTPSFCHSIERLNLSNNHLEGPPYWVWSDTPENLYQLNLSCNINITKSLTDEYFKLLLSHTTLVTDIDIHNCRLRNCVQLMSTFPKATIFTAGISDYSYTGANHLIELPCQGLDKCGNLERLNLCNTYIYVINSNVDMYSNLIEIDLSLNSINGLPNEFCNLKNLEKCVLSYNKLLYLPDDIHKLNKLVILHLDSNQLCKLPECICELRNLQVLDLYDNHLSEFMNGMIYIEELDLAQNYFDEPENEEYIMKKEKLRLNNTIRNNGRKIEEIQCESEKSTDTTDDEELIAFLSNCSNNNNEPPRSGNPPSSPEDWDSDEYWLPRYYTHMSPPQSPWLYFVKRKMEEGNFCPMDAHPVSIAEMVRYEKLCNPRDVYESDGQFDDYSSDDS